MTYTINVFPHVRKFMLKTLPHQNGVFRADELSYFGKMVTLALRDQRAWRNNNDQTRDRLTAQIIIRLTDDQRKMSPRLYKLQRINLDMDRLFKEHLLLWISAQCALGESTLSACRSFLDFYKIDYEYTVDNAYKFWQRMQQKKKTFEKTS